MRALDELCRIYERPLLLIAELRGWEGDKGRDALQTFFLQFAAERNGFAEADPAQGKLRTWLLTALDHSLCGQYAKRNALKRGGGRLMDSLESGSGVESLADEQTENPALAYDRAWSRAQMEEALARFRAEYEGKGAVELNKFRLLWPMVCSGRAGAGERAEASRQLGEPNATTGSTLSRMRRRYGLLLREVVADTLVDPTPERIEEELAALRRAWE